MPSAIQILKTIRDNASDLYIERVPEATLVNMKQVGDAITSEKNIMNEFMNSLINKVAFSLIKSRMFYNPLAKLKSGNGRPYGNTIEEIFVNPSIDQGYSNDGNLLLKTTKPDGKSCYYGLNRQSKYATTISEQQLLRAFNSEQTFNTFVSACTTALYSGDQIDEFTLTKQVFSKAIDEGAVKFIECDVAEPKELAKLIVNTGDYMAFPNDSFNGYNLVNAAKISADSDTKCITFSPIENQVLLVRADVLNEINYEVLANFFHLELSQIKSMVIKIDSFETTNFDTYAVLCDMEAPVVIDDVFKCTNNYNEATLSWNVWLHHWQWLYLSMFANCVAFGKKITA